MRALPVLSFLLLAPIAAPQDFDLLIRGGRIVAMGHLADAKAKRTVDAKGLTVAPGFIDIHNHSDYTMVADGNAQSSEDSQKRLPFSMLARCARAKTHEDRDQADWIDGDKDRNEGEEKFLNHAIRAGISLYAMNVLHNVRPLQQSNLSE